MKKIINIMLLFLFFFINGTIPVKAVDTNANEFAVVCTYKQVLNECHDVSDSDCSWFDNNIVPKYVEFTFQFAKTDWAQLDYNSLKIYKNRDDMLKKTHVFEYTLLNMDMFDSMSNYILNYGDYNYGTGYSFGGSFGSIIEFVDKVKKDSDFLTEENVGKHFCPPNLVELDFDEVKNNTYAYTKVGNNKYFFCDPNQKLSYLDGYAKLHYTYDMNTCSAFEYLADIGLGPDGQVYYKTSFTQTNYPKMIQKHTPSGPERVYRYNYTGATVTFFKANNSDVLPKYEQTLLDIQNYCNNQLASYDRTLCEEAKKRKEDLKELNENLPESEELPEVPSDPIINEYKCDDLLGSSDDKGSPAYYILVVFNVMKYIAIIILIVSSIMDFVGAIASQDNDIIKKAVAKMGKRLILCVIIFIIPTLIDFVLQFINEASLSDCLGG